MASSKLRSLSYNDSVRALNDKDTQADLNAACERFAQSTTALMERFDHISTLLHTIDLQGLSAPMKPEWMLMRQRYKELVWQLRGNVTAVAARLKMFPANILPCVMSARPADQNNLVVLRNYSQISSEFATASRTLVQGILNLNAELTTFNTKFLTFAISRARSGQRELQDLWQKIAELESHSRQLCIANAKISTSDVSHLVYCASRTMTYSGRKGKAKVSYDRILLHGPELQEVSLLEQQLDRTRNEVAHADYTAQLSHSNTDVVTTAQKAISTLVADEILAFESMLCFLLSAWTRLQTDCAEIYRWLSQPRQSPDTPHVIISYQDNGNTLYGTIANALDAYVVAIDPLRFQKEVY
ncbi:hypothetical protein BDN72DRAFT_450399 [Pluteus cervinus]|uniref:Uncharacterized protein n=1 Tax=Pluteus cervinus TaxID=181527 RepID=A0ACD3BBG9_9AGAR|nr:hypothetical protein BDN72DRAFT_450399 [Pluteus cervinus]